ncbi:hypothetical protein BEWA_030310 [Theileria equi strain WA]|uniref:Uncharacterized protein n=1 Tax=Theileria equi strain WA TaxID=1537102 RepID=L0AY38_THEEQ|nr:hypothetical protein BEWA_030310 [Theileria equi strain WA]AFZ80178.1 hypothetical protein BEWA_030310 [Theileria equi strain WA]|eukprot:XP_004829844.1 hypothetical protein BEWA_030310 [Theileria equi strain WA]
MGFFSSMGYALLAPIRALRYKTATPTMKERVIKGGILCRKLWVVFPPIMLYQYIRGTDREMLTTELFYTNSQSEDAEAFYNPAKPRAYRNWKVQHDLALLSAAANQNAKS